MVSRGGTSKEVVPVPGSKGLALDLFSGTGSVGAQLKVNGFKVVSLDCQPSSKADITINILVWDYKKDFKPGDFALIAAGVPCTEYSVAKTTGRPRNLEAADLLVAKTLEIFALFRSKRWWSRTKVGIAQKSKNHGKHTLCGCRLLPIFGVGIPETHQNLVL